MLKRIIPVLLAAAVILSLGGCGKRTDSLKDGYYTAQMAEYSHGWKEFVTLCVSNGELVSVEYNAKNASGYIKSWDMAYMRQMNSIAGTYPNQYTRTYADSFLQSGDVNQIDAIAGASSSYKTFTKLAASALENAKAGNSEVAIVSTDTGD
ncbi:FMN-binding protein [Anaerotruncus colihominis]|uniref:FMN-binding protein n=1 Tax=Anaerotruncus colihominis TaxID=169435 RepID=A0A845RD43_9FIRM|nr:FMN-binding protein [Anaerotruncus colihominis]NBI77479.1 FMN-binding protein [Anaerotruncus colihominis]